MEQAESAKQEVTLADYDDDLAYLMPDLVWDEYHERYGD